jgi:hypothetical protein
VRLNGTSFIHPLEDRNTQFLLRKNPQIVPATYPTVRLNEDPMPSIKQIEKIAKSIVVLELHGLETLLTDKVGLKMFETVMRKLRSHFSVVHLHANNYGRTLNYSGVSIPQVIEMTLVRKDRIKFGQKLSGPEIPQDLDAPNIPGRPDLGLSNDWTGIGSGRSS